MLPYECSDVTLMRNSHLILKNLNPCLTAKILLFSEVLVVQVTNSDTGWISLRQKGGNETP